LIEHLRELQRRLVRSMVAVVAGMVVGYAVFVPLLSWLTEPYCRAIDQSGSCTLVALTPLQPLSLRLYGALLVGLVLAWPVVIWHLWRFVVPGLTPQERRIGLWVTVFGQLLLLAGVSVALVLVPTALNVLLQMAGPGVTPMLDATAYVKFLVTMALAFGLLFQLPLVLLGLIAARVVSTETLRRRRRESLVVGAVVAAVVTPTGDAVTLGFALVILVVLYEAAILIGRVVERRRARRERDSG
jgi:sec-independent protein translocase protein TatC